MGRDGADDPGSTQGMRSQTRRRWLAPAGVDSTGIELCIWASVRVCRYVLGGGGGTSGAECPRNAVEYAVSRIETRRGTC